MFGNPSCFGSLDAKTTSASIMLSSLGAIEFDSSSSLLFFSFFPMSSNSFVHLLFVSIATGFTSPPYKHNTPFKPFETASCASTVRSFFFVFFLFLLNSLLYPVVVFKKILLFLLFSHTQNKTTAIPS